MIPRYYEFDETIASFKIGEMFKDVIQKNIPKNNPPQLYECLAKVKKELPEVYYDIEQSAQGANVPIDQLFGLMCFEFNSIPFTFDHCTDVTKVLEDGRILKGHNEDLNGNLGNTAIVKRIYDGGWYCDIAYEDCLAGSTVFYNNNGLLVSGNFIYNEDYNFDNYPMTVVLRLFVKCKSIEEMKDILAKYPSMSSFNLNVYDRNCNKAYNFEFTSDKLDVFEVKDVSIHTNHLLYTRNDTDTIDQPSSVFRYKKSIELYNQNGISTIEDVASILEYEGEDVYTSIHKKAHKDNALTCFMLLYDSNEKEIRLKDYLNNSIYKEKW